MVTVVLSLQHVGNFGVVQDGVLSDPAISASRGFPFDGGWSGSETHHRRFVPTFLKLVPLSSPKSQHCCMCSR